MPRRNSLVSLAMGRPFNDRKLHAALGAFARERRRQSGLTADAVADQMKCHRQNVFQMEAGVQGWPVARLVHMGLVVGFDPCLALRSALNSMESKCSTRGTKRAAKGSRRQT